MPLHVKQLNADASFLLSFERTPDPTPSNEAPAPFTILTDPWIVGPSKVIHPILAVTTHRRAACVSTLGDLPEPDLVVISQHKSDHCNEATLRQLPPTGTKTLILAVPAAAKLIKNWGYFDESKIVTIPRWEETPRVAGRKKPIIRIPVPSPAGGAPGEVTVAYIPQKRDVSGLHAAIGITYTAPPDREGSLPRCPVTPPATPDRERTMRLPPRPAISPAAQALHLAPPTPPASPSRSFRSIRSARSVHSTRSTHSLLPRPSASRRPDSPALSVIFSPHGISYRDLEPYVTFHLAPSALPLTALLHCFDAVSNPWWLGGNISAGAPAGQETAVRLGARAWVSAHDGDKDVDGLMTKMLRARRYAREEVQRGLAPGGEGGARETEVLMLGVGEEICVNGEGVVESR